MRFQDAASRVIDGAAEADSDATNLLPIQPSSLEDLGDRSVDLLKDAGSARGAVDGAAP